MYYFASPYTKHPKGIARAFRNAAKNAALLTDINVVVFSPIVHFHPMSIEGDLPARDALYWYKRCRPFMEVCDGLIVLMDESWENSDGVNEEIRYFEDKNFPVIYMKPGQVPEELK